MNFYCATFYTALWWLLSSNANWTSEKKQIFDTPQTCSLPAFHCAHVLTTGIRHGILWPNSLRRELLDPMKLNREKPQMHCTSSARVHCHSTFNPHINMRKLNRDDPFQATIYGIAWRVFKHQRRIKKQTTRRHIWSVKWTPMTRYPFLSNAWLKTIIPFDHVEGGVTVWNGLCASTESINQWIPYPLEGWEEPFKRHQQTHIGQDGH